MGLRIRYEKKSFGFDESKTKKAVATPVRGDLVDLPTMVDQVATKSGLTKTVCKGVIEILTEAMEVFLLQGHAVSLGNLGNMAPSIKCKCGEEEGDVKILKKKVVFRPSKEFKQKIEKIKLSKQYMDGTIVTEPDDDDDNPQKPSGGGGAQPPSSGGGGSDTGSHD